MGRRGGQAGARGGGGDGADRGGRAPPRSHSAGKVVKRGERGGAGADDTLTLRTSFSFTIVFMSSRLQFGGPIIVSPQVTALGRLSSQANNSMGYARILARAVSNPGLPEYSFDDINTMSFTTLR